MPQKIFLGKLTKTVTQSATALTVAVRNVAKRALGSISKAVTARLASHRAKPTAW
jgi:hypothetical protein